MDIRDEHYYKIAEEGSSDKKYPSYGLISKYGRKAKRILDIGCGEGTRLALINNTRAEKVGTDQSGIAIALAKKKHSNLKFIKTNDRLPFPDTYFDFVYSAFVLEHTVNPRQFLDEAVRVLSPDGILLVVAPNFGSPNRASPNGKYSRLGKLTAGIAKDLSFIFTSKTKHLNWQKVTPQKKYTGIDADTTVEPYLLTLEKYLAGLNISKINSSSLWSQEEGWKPSQIIFRILGSLGIYPFYYWGPHILFVGKKHE